jgi:hypothetical protein
MQQWLPACLRLVVIWVASLDGKDKILRRKVFFTTALLLASLPALPQQRNNGSHGRQNFDRGVREGGHGGQYYDPRHAHDGYDERFNQRRGGIGPGKGAAIGAAGGAVLGAVLGGGLKGTLIGGAAGAGIGAVVGDAAQNNRDSHHHR